MKTIQFLFGAISIAVALAAPRAEAQNIPTRLIDIDPALEVFGTLDDGAGFGGPYRSGVMNFENTLDFSVFQAFCVEPEVSMNYGDTPTYQIQDISLLPKADQIARLVGAYLQSVSLDPTSANASAAAVHWAIWEITTENSPSFSLLDGNVRVTDPSQVALDANYFLANINDYDAVTLTYLTSAHGQNVVTWNIPEPGTAGLVALSVLGLFRRRR